MRQSYGRGKSHKGSSSTHARLMLVQSERLMLASYSKPTTHKEGGVSYRVFEKLGR